MNIDPESGVISDAQKLTIANQLLSSLHQKDWDLLAAIITEDITYLVAAGRNLLSGIAVGAGEVIDRAKTIVGHNVSIRLNNLQLSYTGFALSLHNEAEQEEVELDENVALVCTLSGKKIAAIKSCLSDLPGMDKFFGGTPVTGHNGMNCARASNKISGCEHIPCGDESQRLGFNAVGNNAWCKVDITR